MTKRIALVTGGTGGIGTAICKRLHDDGYQVVAGYYSGGSHEKAQAWQEKLKSEGYDIALGFGNITSWESCEACINKIREEFGSVDVLVNNGGITRDATLKKMTPEMWHDVINTNLSSVFYMTRLVINEMLEKKWGRIINISSVNAEKGQFGQANYSAAKAGMHGFTKAVAQEVASKGITVNTVSPGYIATSMIMDVPEEIRNQILKGIPVGRFGQPEEIANVISFLAGDASAFVTGSNISANGGQHMS
ncbi:MULTISPECIES: acetoacetyl-CoA reductase [unclassified Oceanobacter]|jgi:acetoacetyl-CoA reductase|uniref:acetoacetyl-CoA reductase n=1 Tax=unclassified Oceanobacter TaxID=2620260 RepID=UPI0026E4473C|nr:MULTISPECIES: acetoacetyl-CoA reductase [unclassified Oceanobacter]MDO6681140.1 acetoacetyl-CoA reductase [Oceanobacter sp. 5_MG-2023]MDP2504288.1 acetoacetyl-CoA reductase [Oceanobacter sp. 3_MG-2023]MDP2546726.1 acetoacetyl-CoA reductase [Oceanobacter sp. 4_MG-2023]MDP2608534.1 acetoacetyl-CoA reductase [Oceanobacter sp. 1_MG-2023]MDP2611704.1 acetoacetyl-CoA reductase [Oceanobacter sp. 2_MG-2023]